jgi:hypothetical protein
MSYLYRSQIASALKARLETIQGVTVFDRLDRPLQPHELPAAIIYTPGARRGPQTGGNQLIERLVQVSIEAGVHASKETALGLADTLAAQIEQAIEADPSLGNLVDNTEWQSTSCDVSSFGEMTIGAVLVTYTVTMFTQRIEDDPAGVVPTQVFINATPTPQAYVQPLDDARLDPPQYVPRDITEQAINPGRPPMSVESACEGDSCDIGAWQGDQP